MKPFMRCFFAIIITAVGFSTTLTSPGSAAASQGASGQSWLPKIRLERVARGFEQPLFVTFAPGDRESLFVVEKTGRIRRVAGGRVVEPPLLDIRSEVSRGYEQGLLSVAFHPRFEENRTFFVNYTDRSGAVRIVRYQTFPDRYVTDPGTRTEILRIDQPAANHNGGMMAFGPDGYLYIATGDGGRAGDPWNNAQSLVTPLGKLLRIDVDSAAPARFPPTIPLSTGRTPGLRSGRTVCETLGAFRSIVTWATSTLRMSVKVNGKRSIFNRRRAGAVKTTVGTSWRAPTASGRPPVASVRGYLSPSRSTITTQEGACSITGGYVYRGRGLSGVARRLFLRGLLLRAHLTRWRRRKSQATGARSPSSARWIRG